MTPEQKRALIGVIIAFVILLVLIIATTWYLLQPTTNTSKIRDVFIIFMALQSILTGITLVILMFQLARLINLLQNEIKPILDSTNETVNNLRGTTTFLSDNLVGPVIKLNEYMAGFTQFMQALGLVRKPRK
jgi:predicted tellurium resistance membrane protein TerC